MNLDNVIYTRYADDMTISFKNEIDMGMVNKIKKMIELQLSYLGLKINEKKFRSISLFTSNHIRITGINICRVNMYNDDNYRYLSVGRSKRELIYKLSFELLDSSKRDDLYYR